MAAVCYLAFSEIMFCVYLYIGIFMERATVVVYPSMYSKKPVKAQKKYWIWQKY